MATLKIYDGSAWQPAASAASSTPGEELAYNQITADVNFAAVSAPSAVLIIDGTTRTYDGTPIIVEFYSAYVMSPGLSGSTSFLDLWDGSTDLGYFGHVAMPTTTASLYMRRRIVPSAGTHNYLIKGWVGGAGGGTGRVSAGLGGNGQFAPAYVRVSRA